jgi:hypothetical protein
MNIDCVAKGGAETCLSGGAVDIARPDRLAMHCNECLVHSYLSCCVGQPAGVLSRHSWLRGVAAAAQRKAQGA